MKKASQQLNILLFFYQLLRTRQEFFRNHQWKVIYYSIALYAAIYVVFNSLKKKEFLILLIIVGAIICAVCNWMICSLNKSLKDSRYNLKRIESVIPLLDAVTGNKPRQELLDVLESDIIICTCPKTGDKSNKLPELIQNETKIAWLLIIINSLAYTILAIVLIAVFCLKK